MLKTGIKNFIDNIIKIAFSWCYRMVGSRNHVKISIYKFFKFEIFAKKLTFVVSVKVAIKSKISLGKLTKCKQHVLICV